MDEYEDTRLHRKTISFSLISLLQKGKYDKDKNKENDEEGKQNKKAKL
jgi:hypothetical protein